MSEAAPPDRRARPTLRCLADLGVTVPTKSFRLDDIAHPALRKAAELAPAHPANQIRIQAIADRMVFRFTHGRNRVLTWLDSETGILWVCGADIRRENEGYDLFIAQHERGELLPDAADVERLEDEAILALAHEIKNGAGAWIADSRAHPGVERRVILLGGATLKLLYAPSEGSDATWIAIPTLLADELGLPKSVRGLIVAAVTEALGGAAAAVDWEQRHDWPTGPLQHFEVAYFWLS